jgi:hypothetical protein
MKEVKITFTTDNDAMRGDVSVVVNKIVSLTSRADAMRFSISVEEGQGELFLSGSSDDTVDYVADLVHNVLVYMVDNVVTVQAPLAWEAIGEAVRSLIPGAEFTVDGTGEYVILTHREADE